MGSINIMALKNEEMMVVVMAIVSVVMSYASTWSPTGLDMIEPLLMATQHRATEIPFSVVATVLTQLQSLQARRAWNTSAVEGKAKPADINQGDAPSHSSDDEELDSSSEEEELESSSADQINDLTDDGSKVTSHNQEPNERRKRQRLTSAALAEEDSILHENIKKLTAMYKDNSDTQRSLHQEKMALHRETLATIREVGAANTTALNRVADALVQLAEVLRARQRDGSD